MALCEPAQDGWLLEHLSYFIDGGDFSGELDGSVDGQCRGEHNAEFHYFGYVGYFFDLVFDAEVISGGFGVFGEFFALGAAGAEYLDSLHKGLL